MQTTDVCPYCNKSFPLDKQMCSTDACWAYRVDDDNYDLSLKERNDLKNMIKNKKVMEECLK